MKTFNEIEIASRILKRLNIDMLYYDESIYNNPYSVIHPGFLYYMWGKFDLANHNEKQAIIHFKKASVTFEKLVKACLHIRDYDDAGEYSILQLKCQMEIDRDSEKSREVYDKAKIIYENLGDIYDEPYYIESLIKIEEIYNKKSRNTFKVEKLDNLYRMAAIRYKIAGDLIKTPELINIKITNYLQAAYYLNEIKDNSKTLDKKEKENIIEKVIFEINTQKNTLNQKQKNIRYSDHKLKTNLYYALVKAYKIVNEKVDALFFLNRALNSNHSLLNLSNLRDLIIESKAILHEEGDYYIIHNLEIHSEEMFQDFTFLLEKTDLMVSQLGFLEELMEFGGSIENSDSILDYRSKLIKLYFKIDKILEDKISSEKTVMELTPETINKYNAFRIHNLHTIRKIKKKVRDY